MTWQPIETAPKDGTLVILYAIDDTERYYAVAWWNDYCKTWDMDTGGYVIGVTHWMPLPQPPEVTK